MATPNTAGPDWIYQEYPVGGANEQVAVDVRNSYVSVYLKYAYLAAVRKKWKTFYGVVHSAGRVPAFGAVDGYTFTKVFTPNGLRGKNPAGFVNLIALDRKLLGPVPYYGGPLTIDVGLYSVEGVNLLDPYIGLLESLTRTASVSFTGAAAMLEEPLRQAVKGLFGDRGDTLVVGLDKTWRSPRPCQVLVMCDPQGGDTRSFVVHDDGHVSDTEGNRIRDRSYLVLEIGFDRERDDWRAIPEVAQKHKNVQFAFQTGDVDDQQAALEDFRLTAEFSDDLLKEDARRIYEKVKARWDDFDEDDRLRGVNELGRFPDLADIDIYDHDAA